MSECLVDENENCPGGLCVCPKLKRKLQAVLDDSVESGK